MRDPLTSILIVDDDVAVGDALKFALEAEGLEVQLYRGGAELIAERQLPRAGCLVVDYNMPQMNGIELVERLRRRDMNTPVVLIAGQVSRELRARAARSGIERILEKPLTDGALMQSLKQALKTGHP
jgi:two-component system response regulator FixJ